MEKFIVKGGRPLCGEVEIQSAKNAVLPLLAASVLTDEKIIIHKCPRIADVLNMVQILGELGCKTQFDGDDLTIDSSDAANHEIPSALAKELRSSVFMLGSVIARFGRARIAYPGGCDIGLRPIDLHLSGLRRLGVKIEEEGGYIDCTVEKTQGADILLGRAGFQNDDHGGKLLSQSGCGAGGRGVQKGPRRTVRRGPWVDKFSRRGPCCVRARQTGPFQNRNSRRTRNSGRTQ